MTLKVFCFDIDNTLCGAVSTDKDYSKVEPIKEMISFVNELYSQGHTIYLYTGRHTMQASVTNQWLEEHQVKYHHLYLVLHSRFSPLTFNYIYSKSTF